ncbi:hypothetical protein ACLB2K_061573 [Fragaria x ananassa]
MCQWAEGFFGLQVFFWLGDVCDDMPTRGREAKRGFVLICRCAALTSNQSIVDRGMIDLGRRVLSALDARTLTRIGLPANLGAV